MNLGIMFGLMAYGWGIGLVAISSPKQNIGELLAGSGLIVIGSISIGLAT